jgi:hypothetical protein
MVWLVLACQQSKPAPPPPPAPADALSELVPIEKVPGLPFDGYDKAQRDCRPSSVARRHFAGARVKPCGTLPLHADFSEATDVTARPCIESALAAKQPFIAEKQLRGTDSAVARGFVGVLEHGELVVYALYFDSNPCGGGCPEAGHTSVHRCRTFKVPKVTADCNDLFDCTECGGDEIADVVEDCIYVSPKPDCVIDAQAQQACEAKGPRFAYTQRRSRFCGGDGPSEAADKAEAKARRTSPCVCLDLVAEREHAKQCSTVP